MSEDRSQVERWQEAMKTTFEEYLFKDIDSMFSIPGNVGNCNFRILAAILDGMESLGAILSDSPYDPTKSYLETFWPVMVSVSTRYKGWESMMRYFLRDMLRVLCSPGPRVVIFKMATPCHMSIVDGGFHISVKMLYEDFMEAYRVFIKPLIARGDTGMMQREGEIIDYFAKKQEETKTP